MTTVYFLSADKPLTKTFIKRDDGGITKEPYPDVWQFTSHKHEVTTSLEFFKVIKKHADEGHCLLKGLLNKDLINERRKNQTNKTDRTDWICLDFDRHQASSVDEELTKLGLSDISYTLQWSSSQGMPGTEGTISCHVFMLMDKSIDAPLLRAWLQMQNFNHYASDIKLTSDANALRWPLDITTCQNDKLLYLATPKFENMTDPLKGNRIEFNKRKHDRVPAARLGEQNPEVLRKKCMDKKNELRKVAGLPTTRAGTTFIGEHEVQNKPGQANVSGIKECGEYTRLNINGSKSWAYWHFTENFELIFTFKDTSIAYRTKELLPNYYADLVAKAAAQAASPNANGDLVLAFRDKRTANYWNGIWNPDTEYLELHPAKSETQLDHWLQAHGSRLGPFVPIWDMTYLPEEDWIVDEDNHVINRFVRTSYMRAARARDVNLKGECPIINRILRSMLGSMDLVWDEFLNWFACIFRRTGKPITSWTLHGVEGTGKGLFFEKIATPLLGIENCMIINMNTIQDDYNAWLKHKLLVVVNEVDVGAFREKGLVTSLLKGYITDPTITIRDMRTIPHSIKNTANFIFASNEDQPVYIPATDRRYNVAQFQQRKLEITAEEIEQIAHELPAFADYLMTLEASVERASRIVSTPDRERIAKLAVTSLQETANAILSGDLEALWQSMPDEDYLAQGSALSQQIAIASAYAALMRMLGTAVLESDDRFNRLTREELRTIIEYNVGNTAIPVKKFTSSLRHNGIELTRIRRMDGSKKMAQGIYVKWRVSDEFLKELAEFFEADKPKLRKIK